jgi:hypothetical protein
LYCADAHALAHSWQAITEIWYLKSMLKLRIRWSLAGFVVSGLFMLLAIAVFSWIFFVASKNPADSGESGLLLLPFAMPWIMWLPIGLAGPLVGIACIFLNALILYFLFGGLRARKDRVNQTPH